MRSLNQDLEITISVAEQVPCKQSFALSLYLVYSGSESMIDESWAIQCVSILSLLQKYETMRNSHGIVGREMFRIVFGYYFSEWFKGLGLEPRKNDLLWCNKANKFCFLSSNPVVTLSLKRKHDSSFPHSCVAPTFWIKFSFMLQYKSEQNKCAW